MQNSTYKKLTYRNPEADITIEVRLADKTVWLALPQIAVLFGESESYILWYIHDYLSEVKTTSILGIRSFQTNDMDNNLSEPVYYDLEFINKIGHYFFTIQLSHFQLWATQQINEHSIKD